MTIRNNAANDNPSGQGNFKYDLRFPGQQYDAESATHYNYFRDYDSDTGRYLQSDPIGLYGGVNTYLYVGAGPLVAEDFFGLQAFPIAPPRLPGVPGFGLPRPIDPKDPGDGLGSTPIPRPPGWLSRIRDWYAQWCEIEDCKTGCMKTYERDAAECRVAHAFWGSRGYRVCMQRAAKYMSDCLLDCEGR